MVSTNPYKDFEIVDPKVMRALAHPVRLALLERLQRHGPATASQLSSHAGTTPSVASWHLRHLAALGLVRDAEPGPDRRERRWEAVARGFRVSSPDSGAESRTAFLVLTRQMFARASELPARWAAKTAPALKPQWQDASGLSNTRLVVTPEEAEEIEQAIEAVLAPFVLRQADDAPDGARGVVFLRYVLPEGDDDE